MIHVLSVWFVMSGLPVLLTLAGLAHDPHMNRASERSAPTSVAEVQTRQIAEMKALNAHIDALQERVNALNERLSNTVVALDSDVRPR